MSRTEALLAELRREFPSLRVRAKRDDALSRLIDVALRVGTLGAQRRYLTHYVTTLGASVYVPSDWDARDDVDRWIVLRHEAVHLRQFRRLGWVGMTLLYLWPIAPLGLAYGRARLEWEAYAETLRATAEAKGLAAARDPALRAHVIVQFTSGAYGWMWPFRAVIERWIDAELARLETTESGPSKLEPPAPSL